MTRMIQISPSTLTDGFLASQAVALMTPEIKSAFGEPLSQFSRRRRRRLRGSFGGVR